MKTPRLTQQPLSLQRIMTFHLLTGTHTHTQATAYICDTGSMNLVINSSKSAQINKLIFSCWWSLPWYIVRTYGPACPVRYALHGPSKHNMLQSIQMWLWTISYIHADDVHQYNELDNSLQREINTRNSDSHGWLIPAVQKEALLGWSAVSGHGDCMLP